MKRLFIYFVGYLTASELIEEALDIPGYTTR
jgi:hypothetical protein